MMHIYTEVWKREATYGGIIHKSTACPRNFEEGKVSVATLQTIFFCQLMASCSFLQL